MTDISQRPRVALLLTTLSLAVLTACGGGDDEPASTPAPSAPTVSSVALVAPPAAGTSGGYTAAGTLNYLVFAPDGSTSTVPAVVAYAVMAGSLTLTAAAETLVASTTDGWAGVTWSTGYAGLLALDGNASLVCKTADDTGQAGISGNVVQVTDLVVLRGKTFQYKACANGTVENEGGITFNQDGSALFSDGSDSATFGPSDVTAYFSEAGWPYDGGVYKARAFSRTTSSGTEYVIVDISDDVGSGASRIKTVSLMIEVQAPR